MFHFTAFGNNFIPSWSWSSLKAVWRLAESQTARHFALLAIDRHPSYKVLASCFTFFSVSDFKQFGGCRTQENNCHEIVLWTNNRCWLWSAFRPLSLSQYYCNLFGTGDSGANFQIYTEKKIGIQYLSL